jgi:hypothetical protein
MAALDDSNMALVEGGKSDEQMNKMDLGDLAPPNRSRDRT